MRSRTTSLVRTTKARERVIALVSTAVAVGGVVIGRHYLKLENGTPRDRSVAWVSAVVVLVAGSISVRHLAMEVGRAITRRASVGSGASARLIALVSGYLLLLFAFLGVIGVSLQRLLIGAGLTGVVFGIAAQQSLGNLFASVILVFARPFVVGDVIRIRSGAIGTVEATVQSIGLAYVTVESSDGTLMIPNLLILSSGIEHAHSKPSPPESGSDDPGAAE